MEFTATGMSQLNSLHAPFTSNSIKFNSLCNSHFAQDALTQRTRSRHGKTLKGMGTNHYAEDGNNPHSNKHG